MTQIPVELPEAAARALRRPPEALAEEVRLAAAALWYSQGRISQEVAAEIAGLDRTEFLLTLARWERESFQVDFADLDRELARG